MAVQTIEHAARRTRRYWFEDGLVEIEAGAVLLCFGLLVAVQAVVLAPLLMLASILLHQPLQHVVRLRLTYPRSGMVRFPRLSPRQTTLWLALGLVGGLLLQRVPTLPVDPTPWLAGVQRLLFTALFLWTAARTDFARFRLLAAFSAVVGVGRNLVLGPWWGWIVHFVLLGLAELASGGLTLRTYRRHASPLVPT